MDKHGRVAIPLVMLPGNMEILLEHSIPCEAISLSLYRGDLVDGEGVILLLHGADSAIAEELGFKLSSAGDRE